MSCNLEELNLCPEATEKLKEWVSQKVMDLFVGVDQGATNARVAIGKSSSDFIMLSKFQASSTRSLLSQLVDLSDWLQNEIKIPDGTIKGGCMAVAGRILDHGSRTEITNYAGGPENQNLDISELPTFMFPKNSTRFLNDLESACYGIVSLNNAGRIGEYFTTLMPFNSPKSDSILLRPSHHLVLAAGTGLGVGLMMHLYGAADFHVAPLEGGHLLFNPVGVSDPFYEEEKDLFNFLGKKIYDGQYSLEYEDLVSGRGLLSLYEWVRSKNTDAPELTEPSQVADGALKNPPCPTAEKALLLHYLYLTRNAQNLSIALNARGVFFAGDNQVNNSEFVFKHKEAIRREFVAHPKAAWIESIPVFIQIKSYQVNSAGALYIAQKSSRE